MITRRRYMGKQSEVPTIKEYIVPYGDAYIDTGITAMGIKVVMDVYIPATATANVNLCGVMHWSNGFDARTLALSPRTDGYILIITSKGSAGLKPSAGYRFTLTGTSGLQKAVDTTNRSHQTTYGVTGDDCPFPLFCVYNPVTEIYGSFCGNGVQARVYSIKLYTGGTLIHDLVPAELNGEHGMYDNETGNFYGNANSSGYFMTY